MFHHGMKVSTRGQLAEMKFHPRMKYSIFLHVIVICFLY